MAPITGNNVGLRKAEIRQGIREIVLCKDQDGKIGLRVQSVNKVRNSAMRSKIFLQNLSNWIYMLGFLLEAVVVCMYICFKWLLKFAELRGLRFWS